MLVTARQSVLVRAVKTEPPPGAREQKRALEREIRWLERVEKVGATAVEREDSRERRLALALELKDVGAEVERLNRRLHKAVPLVVAALVAAVFSGIPYRLMAAALR